MSLDASATPPLGATVYVSPRALSMVGTPVIKLPTSALRKEGAGSAVWVLDKATMTVKSTPVTLTTADGNDAVIGSGLEPGMQVVAAGVHVLTPGQKVTVYQPRPTGAMAHGTPTVVPNAPPAQAAPAASATAAR